MTAAVQYPKPAGLQRMIEAHEDLQLSEMDLARQANPHMTMAGMLTRIARQDAKAWKGGNGMLRLAWDAFAMIDAGRPAAEAQRMIELVS